MIKQDARQIYLEAMAAKARRQRAAEQEAAKSLKNRSLLERAEAELAEEKHTSRDLASICLIMGIKPEEAVRCALWLMGRLSTAECHEAIAAHRLVLRAQKKAKVLASSFATPEEAEAADRAAEEEKGGEA